MTQKSSATKKTKKTLSLPFEACVSIETPIIYFKIQAALQKLGYILIDLETGKELTGQVCISEIGLINPHKPHPEPRRLGFIQPVKPRTPNYSGLDVDAVLVFQEESVNPGDLHCYFINVIDNADVPHWSKVAHVLCQQFTLKVKRHLVPTVVIGVSGLSAPDKQNPHSVKNAVLRKYQKYGFEDSNAVSHLAISPDDCDDYEEDDSDS